MPAPISAIEISIVVAFVMVIIDTVIWNFEKNKRQLHTLEFWLCYLIYFFITHITNTDNPGVVAIPTLIWVWRTFTIRNILSDVCGVDLKKSWQLPFLLSSYVLSGGLYLAGFGFAFFTLPSALANFVLGMFLLNEARICLKKRDRISPVHMILFFYCLCYFFSPA